MPQGKKDMSWTTEAEIRFLKGLGKFSRPQSAFYGALSRAQLLRRYEGAMALRQEWGETDRKVIENAVRQFIAQEER